MNSNAIGLASITMLCTFLIVTVGMTISTYRGISDQVDSIMSDQYRVSIDGNLHNNKKTRRKCVVWNVILKIMLKLISLKECSFTDCGGLQTTRII